MHFDQNIIFIIIAAVIAISRLVSRISEESKKQSQRRRQTPQQPPPQPEIRTAYTTPPASNNGLLTGAQPVVPVGTFNNLR